MRRMDRLVWPVLFFVTVLGVLFLSVNTDILTEKKLFNPDKIDDRQNSVPTSASVNKVSVGSVIQQIAFKAHSHSSAEMTRNLKIALRLISSEKRPIRKNSEKRHDQQFVKSSSGLCPGAYEHAL